MVPAPILQARHCDPEVQSCQPGTFDFYQKVVLGFATSLMSIMLVLAAVMLIWKYHRGSLNRLYHATRPALRHRFVRTRPPIMPDAARRPPTYIITSNNRLEAARSLQRQRSSGSRERVRVVEVDDFSTIHIVSSDSSRAHQQARNIPWHPRVALPTGAHRSLFHRSHESSDTLPRYNEVAPPGHEVYELNELPPLYVEVYPLRRYHSE